jgi:hypothetical protein
MNNIYFINLAAITGMAFMPSSPLELPDPAVPSQECLYA